MSALGKTGHNSSARAGRICTGSCRLGNSCRSIRFDLDAVYAVFRGELSTVKGSLQHGSGSIMFNLLVMINCSPLLHPKVEFRRGGYAQIEFLEEKYQIIESL